METAVTPDQWPWALLTESWEGLQSQHWKMSSQTPSSVQRWLLPFHINGLLDSRLRSASNTCTSSSSLRELSLACRCKYTAVFWPNEVSRLCCAICLARGSLIFPVHNSQQSSWHLSHPPQSCWIHINRMTFLSFPYLLSMQRDVKRKKNLKTGRWVVENTAVWLIVVSRSTWNWEEVPQTCGVCLRCVHAPWMLSPRCCHMDRKKSHAAKRLWTRVRWRFSHTHTHTCTHILSLSP